MKSYFIEIILFLISTICLNNIIIAQITRGTEPGEIYIATDWYADNTGMYHRALFHSVDNGASLNLQYETTWNPPPGEMKLARIIGDATPGALYNYGWNELWVSFDYGMNWEYKEYLGNTNYMSGQIGGVIFRRVGAELSVSYNYGSNFSVVTSPINCPIRESGYYLGEFYGINGDIGVGLFLDHTLDYAYTFTEIPLDSTVAFWSPSGHYPQISRGTEPGELYLVSWWPDYHYKIFHSFDTGYTWTQKYESDYINIYYWDVDYTAGREPGSFYVIRGRLTPDQTHTWLYIDYSDDYGETFTTFFHDLDSLYTSIPSIQKQEIELSAFPNPFKSKTTIRFNLPEHCKNPMLNIYDFNGTPVKQYNIVGKCRQQWDGSDNTGTCVPDGLYFYNISYNKHISKLNKLLFIN